MFKNGCIEYVGILINVFMIEASNLAQTLTIDVATFCVSMIWVSFL